MYDMTDLLECFREDLFISSYVGYSYVCICKQVKVTYGRAPVLRVTGSLQMYHILAVLTC